MSWSDIDERLERAARNYAGEDDDLYDAFMAGASKGRYLALLKKGVEHGEPSARKRGESEQIKEYPKDEEQIYGI